ncbi:hypothetical protein KPH14_008559 [Odynerus spinipes]|uniref:DUF4485 domain-containing protein n=1 Tax=Odynerus spinipes TaxID=1348599 RepID=A0AAD9RTM9_9HYME|nr:hypothetical protein KPH14_008559 [Odynerus spinipes]
MSTKNDDDEDGKDNDDGDGKDDVVEDDKNDNNLEDKTNDDEEDKNHEVEDDKHDDEVDVVEEAQKVDENENFVYNDMLARALVQLFPREERTLIHMWLEKLRKASVDNTEKLSNRNNYMWLLLSVLQNGSLVEPFDEAPPIDELPPICDIMPAQMIEEMIASPDRNLSHLDATSSDANVMDLKEPSSIGMPPRKFLDHQPRPVNGISCYFSVFSRPT